VSGTEKNKSVMATESILSSISSISYTKTWRAFSRKEWWGELLEHRECKQHSDVGKCVTRSFVVCNSRQTYARYSNQG